MSNGVMVITGASRGIGAATAQLAARSGWDVVVGYRNDSDRADAVAEVCRSLGVRGLTVRVDVADESGIASMFDTAVRDLGGIDAFVNNAGILHPARRLDEISTDRLREVVEINLVGAFVAAREAVRRMSTRHGGRGGAIVNVSSAASYLGSPNEFVDYAMTKGALDTMTIGLAKEVATEGIRVNAVRPGLIETEIHASSEIVDRIGKLAPSVPMQRGGRADEVAAAIVWLASDAASYVTGAFIDCTGGR